MPKKCSGIELGFGSDLRPGNAQALLQILFIADQHVDILHDAVDDLDCAFVATLHLPELLAEVEIEGGDGSSSLGLAHAFDGEFGAVGGERGEDAAGVEPAHATRKNRPPVHVAGFHLRRGLVAAVIENDRRTNALPAIAVDGGHVGPAHAVVFEVFVEGLDAHGAHAFCDQFADGVVDHGGDDAGPHAEAVGEIGGDIELAATDMDAAFGCLAEGDDTGIEAVHQGTQRQKIQRGILGDGQSGTQGSSPSG